MKYVIGFMTLATTVASVCATVYALYMWKTVGYPTPEKEGGVIIFHAGLFLLISVTIAFWALLVREE